jgi:uncharacterized membrane protein YdjX (TVP38/TMEM64 family)
MTIRQRIALVLLSTMAVVFGVILLRKLGIGPGWLDFILNKDTNPWVFVALMAVLPVLGAPISVFLVLVGVKFGVFWGIAITAGLMPLHMAASYAAAHSALRKPLKKFLASRGRALPELPENRKLAVSALFLAIPGPPYALKNYLLPLAGVRLGMLLLLGWPINLVLALPFVGLGGSAAEMDFRLALFGAVMAAGYVLVRVLQRRYGTLLSRKKQPAPDPPAGDAEKESGQASG